jgi:16S rRNA (adenine1518-N6/adenine1519-N6)-dimethyltransferase
MSVRPKKHLGQHFLTDAGIAERIASSLPTEGLSAILEIGPGMGILTQPLLQQSLPLWVAEIDTESVAYLQQHFPTLAPRILAGDFLRMDLKTLFPEGRLGLIGNFPYNISSQILFKMLENKELIVSGAGMFQKEVAQRVASGPGTKDYGILSVVLQAYYRVEYQFTVNEGSFNPPPKVKSGVISMQRLENPQTLVPYPFFLRVVKSAFGQRRKTLRNALKGLTLALPTDLPYMDLRAEQLSVAQFDEIARRLYHEIHPE